jgi:hypothetical protein
MISGSLAAWTLGTAAEPIGHHHHTTRAGNAPIPYHGKQWSVPSPRHPPATCSCGFSVRRYLLGLIVE